MVLNVTATHQEKNYTINKHHFFLWKIKVGFMYTRKCVRCSTLCLLLWHVLTDWSHRSRNIYRNPEEVLPWCSEDVSHTHLLSTKEKKKTLQDTPCTGSHHTALCCNTVAASMRLINTCASYQSSLRELLVYTGCIKSNSGLSPYGELYINIFHCEHPCVIPCALPEWQKKSWSRFWTARELPFL